MNTPTPKQISYMTALIERNPARAAVLLDGLSADELDGRQVSIVIAILSSEEISLAFDFPAGWSAAEKCLAIDWLPEQFCHRYGTQKARAAALRANDLRVITAAENEGVRAAAEVLLPLWEAWKNEAPSDNLALEGIASLRALL